MEMGTGPQEGALAAPLPPPTRSGGPQWEQRGPAGSCHRGAGLSFSLLSPSGHGPLQQPIGAADDRLRCVLHGSADTAGDLRRILEVSVRAGGDSEGLRGTQGVREVGSGVGRGAQRELWDQLSVMPCREGADPGDIRRGLGLGLGWAPSLSQGSSCSTLETWDREGMGEGQSKPPAPWLSAPRFIKSERSIILLNFCVSILASNVLILVGQSQMLSKVGTAPHPPCAASHSQPPDWIWINSISGLNALCDGFGTTLTAGTGC